MKHSQGIQFRPEQDSVGTVCGVSVLVTLSLFNNIAIGLLTCAAATDFLTVGITFAVFPTMTENYKLLDFGQRFLSCNIEEGAEDDHVRSPRGRWLVLGW
jgi:hypothetical protein